LKLTNGCFKIMDELRFNICSLPSSFIADRDVPDFDETVKKCIGEALQYCCRFWSYHFIQCEIHEEDVERLEKFLQAKGVYWLEAMSLLSLLAQCYYYWLGKRLNFWQCLGYSESTSKVRAIIRYLQNLLLQFCSGEVQGRTPHLYLSIMPLWSNSVGCMPKLTSVVRVERLVVNQPDTAVLRGHDQWVKSVAFSPDGTRIVSGSGDKTVRIWDANTGAQIGDPLHGHDNWVSSSVAFSPDGTRIVSGSGDKTVRIWDANTGAQIGDPLHGHDNWVSSVAFSPDGTRIVIVSGSSDETVRIWDANTGAQIGDLLHGHDDTVFSVAFSPDGTRIVSGSGDKTVRIWDANTGAQIGDPLHGHDDTVFSMACSPNGTRIPSGSEDNIVRIWD
ncbi:WD40 repeat-like protein, partial [Gymnopus androsaceus JB14]